MTKVKMNIAGGYLRGEIVKIIDDNPQRSPEESVIAWVHDRYGSWVRKYMETENYQIGDIEISGSADDNSLRGSFTIDFDDPNQEDFFVKHVGGKIVPN